MRKYTCKICGKDYRVWFGKTYDGTCRDCAVEEEVIEQDLEDWEVEQSFESITSEEVLDDEDEDE